MQFDLESEVINGPGTYESIAVMAKDHAVMVGWTDGLGSHFDILLTFARHFEGRNIQGGVSKRSLFVSIMRVGAFGFSLETELHPHYVAEKLNMGGGPTTEKLTKLLNGVIAETKKL